MKKAKIIIGAVAAAIAAVLVWAGLSWYQDYRREHAEQRAVVCLREYTRIVGDGRTKVSSERLGPVLAEMADLTGACGDSMREALFTRRLDGAFLIGDYAQAERMMDDLPGKSANWKTGAKAKIRAHAALERGDKALAIREFEVFCETLLKEDPNTVECDPCSGIEWSREGLLARNFKRMSALATEIGDARQATDFRERARQHAKVALQKAEDDKETHDALLEELGPLVK